MAKTIFEKAGGTYTQVGDYMLPDLLLAEEEKEANIGIWEMRHKRYLKQNHKVLYYNLMTSGKLNSYLADIEQQAQNLFLRLVKELAEKLNMSGTELVFNVMINVEEYHLHVPVRQYENGTDFLVMVSNGEDTEKTIVKKEGGRVVDKDLDIF